MDFLADHNCNENVCDLLEARNHIVTRLRNVLPPDTPDPMVAQTAIVGKLVLLTQDTDFRSFQRGRHSQRQAFRDVHLLWICDAGPETRRRLAEVIDLVEFEIHQRLAVEARVYIEVHEGRVIINR